MASKQQESLKATWVYNIAGYKKTLTLLQPTATSSKVMKHTGRLMKVIIYICIHIIYIHIYIYMDCFPPPHKQEIIFRTFNKTTPLAKIRSLTEAASVYLGLLCSTALATRGRDCKGWCAARGCELPCASEKKFSLHKKWMWTIHCKPKSQPEVHIMLLLKYT